MNSTEKKL